MEIPAWLSGQSSPPRQPFRKFPETARKSPFRAERFLDRTLNHAISFIEDVVFNESLSARKGFLQGIEPKVKISSLLMMIVALGFQGSSPWIAAFLLIGGILVFASRIPPLFFMKRLLPAAILTALIAMPATLNLIVHGEPLLVLHKFTSPITFGPVLIPEEIAITKQGAKSAAALLFRAAASVSFVYLMTMTTSPNRLIKSLSSFFPGFLRSVISISYRYIFFLVRRVEQSIMGLKSRRISALTPARGRHWTASRIGLLFLISMELSSELGIAMESRGYKGERSTFKVQRSKFKVQSSKFKVSDLSLRDIMWLSFTIVFCGAMTWISFR